MKVSIIGYGVMGRLIEQSLKEKNIEVASIIDPVAQGATHKEIDEESLKNTDVCIDFTIPKIAVTNIEKIALLKKNIVMGTTGWYEDLDKVKNIVKKSGIGFIWSGNFSIGVNMFFKMIEQSAKIVDKIEDYDILSYEMHHNRKKDSPSGTAEMIGNILIENIGRKKTIIKDKLDRQIKPDELHLASVRGGDIPGTHVVDFDSTYDTIELKHTARSRLGFAKGSVIAAEFIYKKKGFFTIDDLMREILK